MCLRQQLSHNLDKVVTYIVLKEQGVHTARAGNGSTGAFGRF